MPQSDFARPLLAVSSCLLGDKVRYDGGHKRSPFVESVLAQHVDYEKVCPEMGIGLPVPRRTIHLVQGAEGIKLCQVDDHSIEHTEQMRAFAQQQLARLSPNISGYILKSKSPSCGYQRIKLYKDSGEPLEAKAQGLYTTEWAQYCPALPMEDEGRLNDAPLRENFITRVYVYQRWLALQKQLSAEALLQFHQRHKLMALAHHQGQYRALGKLLANLKHGDLPTLAQDYFEKLMRLLAQPASRRDHSNVLQHLMGYLKKHLDAKDKQELLEAIDQYRLGTNPLLVPLTLLQHHFRRYPDPYVMDQYYLNPYPAELMLRNPL